ncbi:Fe-S oxidoreductase [Opitutaceae bacterium TAV1]|nr:Fe-S oxidoreductase [Opitutaceae bacterium TAV1]
MSSHHHRSPRPNGKRLQLMATCLCDAIYDDVAIATVEVLEHLGCDISFPEAQTCCGQPAFNGGDWPASRKVVRHTVKTFADDAGGPDAAADVPVVVPSGSCAAMMFHGALLEFENEPDLPDVAALGRRTWELTDYIVNGLGVKTWPGKFEGKVAFHRSCHSRGTPTPAAVHTLLDTIEGLTVLPFGEAEQCCGFGGTFSVTFPHISKAMGELKLDHILSEKPDYIVSIDMSCLMSLSGLAAKGGRPVKIMHISQLLRDSLRNAGKLRENP